MMFIPKCSFLATLWTRDFPFVMRSRKADLPLATRARKRERCLRGTYRDWFGSKILSQFFRSFFLETTFLHVSCYPVHCEPKTYFWFFEVCTYPSIHNFGLEASPFVSIKSLLSTTLFPLVMRSRKADLPLATRARKRELCLYRYVSRMTLTEKILSQFFS